MPDRLFNSANASDVHPVLVGNVTIFKLLDKITQPSLKRYKVVQFTITTNASSWFYARAENKVTSSNLANDEYLLKVVRTDGREIWVEKNAWQTTHIKNIFLFHLLDFVSQDSNEAIEISYNITFGPRNIYAPKFTSSEYMASVSINAALGTTILILNAYDIDNDTYSFKLKNQSSEQFSVEKNTGEIIVANKFTFVGTITFEVVVEDSGIPSKSSFAVVIVKVNDGDMTSSPLNTTLLITTITATNLTSTKPSNAVTNGTMITTHVNPNYTHYTHTRSDSIATDKTPSSSSAVVTLVSSTNIIMSTTPRNVTNKEEQAGSTPFWVIPTAIAAAVLILLVITLIGLIYALRKRSLLKSYVI
ncbi:hypothetical protein CHS0354_002264 [Potamilus streckersoni]|uniref:Cadherin domain-containing protein n=1 Tax=Potamilus streckersoni TaxID=2493646 RepID=A0AAE0VNH0_9BIVA|nr:hypothetical protein CHS0354_002264 [Potamilus streckersoni]